MKTVLFLGAAVFQIPPIKYALARGYRIVTCDNVPGNPGHQLAHKHYNVSTTDLEGVLNVARRERVDGILTFGSDVSAPAVGYVAQALDLPGNSYASICTLTKKDRFRALLNERGLQPQVFATFRQVDRPGLHERVAAMALPLVVKPVDASGSKGVSIVTEREQIDAALGYAFAASMSGTIVVEAYVQKRGKQVCGDGFMQQGKLVFVEFGDGHFYDDGEFLAPYAETFPSAHPRAVLDKVRDKLERVLQAAGFRSGAFNLDVLITQAGEPFIIEIGPRNGGNYLPRAIALRTNVDLVAASVEAALDCDFRLDVDQAPSARYYACYMVHARHAGVLRGLHIAPQLSPHVVEYNEYLPVGAAVQPFRKANEAIGNLILGFDDFGDMQDKMARIHSLCQVQLQ